MTTDSDTAPTTGRPVTIDGVDGLHERVGTELGVSDWVLVEQEKVNTFAVLTGDEQWIHVDPERAAAGPFGVTVQHGFLTLGMSTGLLFEMFTVRGVSVILNYGLNKVRFMSPLKVGSRFRTRATLAEDQLLEGGIQVVFRLVYEVEGEAKPCCVADLVFRYYS
jgi:acyl dehydratase